jgi:hypothetical protein
MAGGAREFGAAGAGAGRAQLGALVWLKWRLLRNSLRSRRGAANRAATAVGTLAAAALSLLFAAGMGAAGYWLARTSDPAHAAALLRGDAAQPMLLLFGLLSMLLLMWALVPLSLGGGTGFDPGPLLLYPISLRKLFLVDLLSELSSLSTLFAAPSLVAVGLGAGLASGRVAQSLVAAGVAACFGGALAKLVSTAVASLMQARRARGEMLLAALGIVGAFSGLIVNRGFELIRRTDEFPAALRWTPPGALVSALTAPQGGAGVGEYLLALATLGVYAAAAVALTYAVAVRSLRSSGGAGKRRAAGGRGAGAETASARAAAGWRVPLLPVQLAAVFEKEMRYALRNAQLRVIVLMPVVVTVALSFGFDSRRRGFGDFGASSPYFAGVRDGLGMFYVFVILSALGGNLFGFDGAGARAYVLAPVARRTILVGKNLAVLCVAAVAAVAVTVTNRLIHGGAGWGAHLFAALCFVHFAAFFQLVGNYTSVRFPRRLQFGRRMNASGVSGLLMIPTMLAALAPPALAAVAGWLSGRVWIEYVILAAFASLSVAAYLLLIGAQGRELERRELDILEVVTGRDDA